MKKFFLVLILLVSGCLQVLAQNALCKFGDVNPLDIEFKRLAVRRFIFSNNIPLNEFVPSEIVYFSSMHPAFKVSETESPVCDREFSPKIEKGKLVLDQDCGKEGVAFFAGGVNPYAVYEVDIESIAGDAEVGVELAGKGLRNRVQVYAGSTPGKEGIFIRIYCNGAMEREVRCTDSLPEGAFVLRMQSYGKAVAVYIEQYGESVLVGRIADKENFSRIIDFRDIKTAGNSTFNVISNLKGRAVVGGARSYLSTGIGQADIRLISYEDLSPYFYEDRLWFTFSIRGIDICQSAQGILSLDPSVFDPKLEGVVVFDHGDGLLRNDYSSHLFFDRTDNQWKAVACDFGGTAGEDERSGTRLLTATSAKLPLKGFTVMKAKRIETDHIVGSHEDPCIFYDREAGKWRMLTSTMYNNGILSKLFESDSWDGYFTQLGPEITLNSTGTSLQKVGDRYYAFMGGAGCNLRCHSYPDLELLGELDTNFQPHWPEPAARIWASLVPLPEGYPYEYILLTMDRPNFPGITGANWSYGALYFFGGNLKKGE